MIRCLWCGAEIRERDIVGINRKLLGEKTTEFYCLPCFADYLDCTEQDILQKIRDFKEEGCKLFT